jgi:hypothetical protein
MRKQAPGEGSWKEELLIDPYSKLVEGIITSVNSSMGYATVRILQQPSAPRECRISFQSIGAFCNARVMPCVGDMVLVGYARGNSPQIIGYVAPARAKTMSSKIGLKDELKDSLGGYNQLLQASKSGEEWTITSPNGGTTSREWQRKIVFRKLASGEYNFRSGSPEFFGGAEIYGEITGTLHLMGGPSVLMKLVMDNNENQQYAELFRRMDADISSSSNSIEERFGTVRRKPIGNDAKLTFLDPEVDISTGGITGGVTGISNLAKEYSLKIKRKIGFGSLSKRQNLIEIKYGDVIDNKGKVETNPLTGEELRAKMSVYNENDPSGSDSTTFKVDKEGNIYIKQMAQAKKFTVIGLLSDLWLQFKTITLFYQEDKKEYITNDSLNYVGGTQTNISMDRVDMIAKGYTTIVTGDYKLMALKVDLLASQVRLGIGGYQRLVNESFLTNLFNSHTHGGVDSGTKISGPPELPAVPLVHTTITTEAG